MGANLSTELIRLPDAREDFRMEIMPGRNFTQLYNPVK